MKRTGSQCRILKVLELLKRDSDENNALSTSQIIEELNSIGIFADRRTIYNDINELNDMGYEILCKKGDHQKNLYYVLDREFDLTELGILIDAVQAASFITEKKTKALTDKIAALGGSAQGEILKHAKVDFNTTKHSNEEIYYNIDHIQTAINEKKKLSYEYFDFDAKCQKKFRKNQEKYIVSPVATVVDNDNYYFYAYHENHKSIATYRIDRMVKVEVLEEPIDEMALTWKKQIAKNIKQAFGMFSGEDKEVTLEVNKSLIDVLIDKFGENIILEDLGDKVRCTQHVMVSDQFYGWCCCFNNKLKVVKPESVVNSLKDYMKRIQEQYEED